MDNYLLISDAAREVKVESHVLRYWEEELRLPIKRNELGHRYYTQEDVERFKQIKGMKERGLQLKAIKMILKDGRLDVLSGDTEVALSKSAGNSVRNNASSSDETRGVPSEEAEGMEAQELGQESGGLAIEIVPEKPKQLEQESKEDKSRRLQWLLQQLIRQTLQENNGQLCREIRDNVVKELDYQFRMQEEREEARDRMLAERDEEHYKRMDELLRRKSHRLGRQKAEKPSGEEKEKTPKTKKKRFF